MQHLHSRVATFAAVHDHMPAEALAVVELVGGIVRQHRLPVVLVLHNNNNSNSNSSNSNQVASTIARENTHGDASWRRSISLREQTGLEISVRISLKFLAYITTHTAGCMR